MLQSPPLISSNHSVLPITRCHAFILSWPSPIFRGNSLHLVDQMHNITPVFFPFLSLFILFLETALNFTCAKKTHTYTNFLSPLHQNHTRYFGHRLPANAFLYLTFALLYLKKERNPKFYFDYFRNFF